MFAHATHRRDHGMGRTEKLGRVAVAVVARMPSSMTQERRPRPRPPASSYHRCKVHRTCDREHEFALVLEVKKLERSSVINDRPGRNNWKTDTSFMKLKFHHLVSSEEDQRRSHLYSREAPRRLACAPGCPKILPLHNCVE